MTFLQLCQRLRQECEIPGTGPSATTNQTGQMRRLVDWIASAWDDVQRGHSAWRWMRRPFSLNTVAGTDNYAFGSATDVDAGAAISRFSHWWAHDDDDPYLAYLQSVGVAEQYRLVYTPWEYFKWLYRFGTQNNSKPVHVSVDHQNKLCLGPRPDGVYVVTGDFQRGLQVLAADADIPEMPTRFHDLIWRYALHTYGANSVAAELVARAELESARLLSSLEADQLPIITMPEPLV